MLLGAISRVFLLIIFVQLAFSLWPTSVLLYGTDLITSRSQSLSLFPSQANWLTTLLRPFSLLFYSTHWASSLRRWLLGNFNLMLSSIVFFILTNLVVSLRDLPRTLGSSTWSTLAGPKTSRPVWWLLTLLNSFLLWITVYSLQFFNTLALQTA